MSGPNYSYGDGTISLDQAATTVTGTGTAWSTTVRAGDEVHAIVGTAWVFVGLVSGDDDIGDLTFELQDAYPGADIVDASYRIKRGIAWLSGAAISDTLSRFLTELGPMGLAGASATAGPPDDEDGRENQIHVDSNLLLSQKRGGVWVALESRPTVLRWGSDTAAFQAAIDDLPSNGGTVLVPPGDYSDVVPATLDAGAKVVTWTADRGVTLPADMPGVVQTQGNYSINDWSGNGNRDGNVHWHIDLGVVDGLNGRDRAFHVTGSLADNAADDRVLAAYSFHLETDHAGAEGGDIRGLYGVVAGDGGGANIRAIRVMAEGKNGHTGNLTGILATAVHTDSEDDVASSVGSAVAAIGAVGAGCRASFLAEAFNGSQRPSFGYAVSTSAGGPLRPEVAQYFAHGGGNGDMFRGRRDIDGAAGGDDVTYSVDNKARMMARSFYSGRRTIADDAFIAIALDDPLGNGASGFIRFWVIGNSGIYGEAYYRVNASPLMTQVFKGAGAITLATGALAGTTGADGDLTVSAHSDGSIYVENRTGEARAFAWAFTAASSQTGNLS